MALHLHSIVISAIPRNSTLCALQDPYQCVDVTGCGFCLTSWTCMVGDENGTAAGALSCEYNASRFQGGCAWAPDASRLDECNELQTHPPTNIHPGMTFALMRPPQSDHDDCVPAEYDTLCVGGGQRHWGGCFLPYNESTCQDLVDTWGSQSCDCPTGRNGRTCSGCSSSDGCNANEACSVPDLASAVDHSEQGQRVALGCTVRSRYDVSSQYLAPYIFGNGAEPSLDVRIDATSLYAAFTKAVDFPYSAVSSYGESNTGVRILGGTSFIAQANNSKTKYVTSSTEACPTDPQWQFPFGKGDTCVHWHVSAALPPKTFLSFTPTSDDWHGAGSFLRYNTDITVLGQEFRPPIDVYCSITDGSANEGNDSADAGAAGPSPPPSDVACAMRAPVTKIAGVSLTINLHCQVEGSCHPVPAPPPENTPRQPPSPPASPPAPPAPPPPGPGLSDLCYERENAVTCTYLVLFGPPALILSLGALCFVMRWVIAGCVILGRFRTTRYTRRGRRPRQPTPESLVGAPLDTAPLLLLQPAPPLMTPMNSQRTVPSSPGELDTDASPAADANGGSRGSAPGQGTRKLAAQSSGFVPLSSAARPTSTGSSVALSWRGIGYSIGSKQLLQPSSAQLNHGLHCLIGPSGSGKSTLLGVLCGRKTKGVTKGGTVSLHECQTPAAMRRGRLGYVTQDDMLPSTSTVCEHLTFHARLRASWLDEEARAKLVDSALQSVAMVPKAHQIIGDSYVRGLSGGERRRVSVAVELLVAAARASRAAGSSTSSAPVLIMDEPCSGLDSFNTRLLLHALVSVTKGGAAAGGDSSTADSGAGGSACVLLSVHQPTERFLRAMGGCLVMAPGGHLLYAGPMRTPGGRCAISDFFDASRGAMPRLKELSPNPAEAVLEMVSGEDDETLLRIARMVATNDWSATDGRSSGQGGARNSRADSTAFEDGWIQEAGSANAWTQICALTGRHWTLIMRHPLLVATNIVSTGCIALVCAWAFWKVNLDLSGGVLQRMGLLFFLGAHFLLTGIANIGVWKEERLLYFHERGVGCYGTMPYVFSKTILADALPMRILPALLCAVIIYPTVGLAGIDGPDSAGGEAIYGPAKAGMFVASLCLTNLAASAMFSCIGIACPSTAFAVLVGVLYALFTLLFSGFLANVKTLQFSWLGLLSYLSILKYCFELVMSNELLGQIITVTRKWPGGSGPQPKYQPVSGQMIVHDYLGFNTGWEERCWRVISLGDPYDPAYDPSVQISACWLDLYVPALWFVAAMLLSVVLLKYFARDPH